MRFVTLVPTRIMALLVKLSMFTLYTSVLLLVYITRVTGRQVKANYSIAKVTSVVNPTCLVKVLMTSVGATTVNATRKAVNIALGIASISELWAILVKRVPLRLLTNEVRPAMLVRTLVAEKVSEQLQRTYSIETRFVTVKYRTTIDSMPPDWITLVQKSVSFGTATNRIRVAEANTYVALFELSMGLVLLVSVSTGIVSKERLVRFWAACSTVGLRLFFWVSDYRVRGLMAEGLW